MQVRGQCPKEILQAPRGKGGVGWDTRQTDPNSGRRGSELREPRVGAVQNLNTIPTEKRPKELEVCPPLPGFPELA